MADILKTFIRLYKQVELNWKTKSGKHYWIVPLNDALENVCRQIPSRDAANVYAKVRLINRAYSANLERTARRWPEMVVAKSFFKYESRILKPLHSVRELNRNTLANVVNCHTELMNLAQKVTGAWNVSFCSKYLSFHFPQAAPVFDSLACSRAKALVPDLDAAAVDEGVLEHDYGCHCLRVLWLLARLHNVGIQRPSLRVIDFVLYEALDEAAIS